MGSDVSYHIEETLENILVAKKNYSLTTSQPTLISHDDRAKSAGVEWKKLEPTEWWFRPADLSRPEWKKHEARGLYCLGVEEEGVLAQINVPLSMHDKMELRLSLPREFWPKTWQEGEETQ